MVTSSLKDKYQLERFNICCTEYNSGLSGPPVKQKSVGYISVHNDNIFIETPPDNYRPDKLSDDVTIDSLQQQRIDELQESSTNQPKMI